MADLRVIGGLPATALKPAQPTEAARSAQRAFFQAALNATAPSVPVHPVETQPAQRSVSPAQPVPAGEPVRYLRPGSLLDIKV